jgi:hypothetical protein
VAGEPIHLISKSAGEIGAVIHLIISKKPISYFGTSLALSAHRLF